MGQEASLAPSCSNLSSFGSKCTVLKKYLWHCWDFSAPPAVIRRLILTRRPRKFTPLPSPSVPPLSTKWNLCLGKSNFVQSTASVCCFIYSQYQLFPALWPYGWSASWGNSSATSYPRPDPFNSSVLRSCMVLQCSYTSH